MYPRRDADVGMLSAIGRILDISVGGVCIYIGIKLFKITVITFRNVERHFMRNIKHF